MNITSYNFRGCGSPLKRKRIQKFILKGKEDMFFLQETKLKVINDELVERLWGNLEVDWSAK